MRSFILALLALMTGPTTLFADGAGPEFPVGYYDWKHTVVGCFHGRLVSSQPTESVEAGEPNWVYLYQVDGVDIAVVTWVNSGIGSVQVLIGDSWYAPEVVSERDAEALVASAKLVNGFPSSEQMSDCSRVNGYLRFGN